jgi:hypothetical protein
LTRTPGHDPNLSVQILGDRCNEEQLRVGFRCEEPANARRIATDVSREVSAASIRLW